MNSKKVVGEAAVEFIEDGMTVGLGTGSTAYWAIMKIGERVKEGLKITAIATSKESESLAERQNIPLATFSQRNRLDITIDGADEVDRDLNLIKGGGGALLREKIIASASDKLLILVDETKLVKRLGQSPLPVEVVPFGMESTREKIKNLGCEANLRFTEKQQGFITDNGNYIIDCAFRSIHDPKLLSQNLSQIPGVVENGLFMGLTHKVLVGRNSGRVDTLQIKDKQVEKNEGMVSYH